MNRKSREAASISRDLGVIWRYPLTERPEVLSEALIWQPQPSQEPLTLELLALFAEMLR